MEAKRPANKRYLARDIYNFDLLKCKRCDTAKYVIEAHDGGSATCTKCGTVVARDIVSDAAEWRSFSQDEGRNKGNQDRVGRQQNKYLAEYGVTVFSTGTGELGRSGVRNADREKMVRAMSRAHQLMEKLGMKRIVHDKFCEVYKRLYDTDKLRKRNFEAVVVTCLFIASRVLYRCSHTLKEICGLAGVSEKAVRRVYKFITNKSPELVAAYQKLVRSTEQEQHVTRGTRRRRRPGVVAAQLAIKYCSDMNINDSTFLKAAKAVAENMVQFGEVTGKQPDTLAGTAIYIASRVLSGYDIKLDKITKVVAKAPKTLLDTARTLHKYRAKLIPESVMGVEKVKDLPMF